MPAPHSKPGMRATVEASEANKAARNAEKIEHRASTRIALAATAEVVELVSEAKIAGRCTDLSLGGCYVDTVSPFPIGTPVKLRLTLDNRAFESRAAVVYALAGMGMGLAFTEIKPDQLMTLRDWLCEPSGKPAPPSNLAQAPAARQSSELKERLVLNQLINLLMRKRILTEREGLELLRDLFG